MYVAGNSLQKYIRIHPNKEEKNDKKKDEHPYAQV